MYFVPINILLQRIMIFQENNVCQYELFLASDVRITLPNYVVHIFTELSQWLQKKIT